MTDIPSDAHDEFMEKSWRLLNLQADTMLKWQQSRTEIWKVVIAAMGAGAALVTAGGAIGVLLARTFHLS